MARVSGGQRDPKGADRPDERRVGCRVLKLTRLAGFGAVIAALLIAGVTAALFLPVKRTRDEVARTRVLATRQLALIRTQLGITREQAALTRMLLELQSTLARKAASTDASVTVLLDRIARLIALTQDLLREVRELNRKTGPAPPALVR